MNREERHAAFRADPDDERHGKASAYRALGCRCDKCREGNRIQARIDREQRLTRRIPPRVHGTMNGYGNYNCRCDDCRRANRVYYRDVRKGGVA